MSSPPDASAIIDARAPTMAAAHRLERAVRGLRPVLEGATIEVEGGFDRPPMEPLPRNRALLATAQRLGHELGLSLEDAGLVGGGSDANTTSLFTATLDGLGPVGEGSHASDERVDTTRCPGGRRSWRSFCSSRSVDRGLAKPTTRTFRSPQPTIAGPSGCGEPAPRSEGRESRAA